VWSRQCTSQGSLGEIVTDVAHGILLVATGLHHPQGV